MSAARPPPPSVPHPSKRASAAGPGQGAGAPGPSRPPPPPRELRPDQLRPDVRLRTSAALHRAGACRRGWAARGEEQAGPAARVYGGVWRRVCWCCQSRGGGAPVGGGGCLFRVAAHAALALLALLACARARRTCAGAQRHRTIRVGPISSVRARQRCALCRSACAGPPPAARAQGAQASQHGPERAPEARPTSPGLSSSR